MGQGDTFRTYADFKIFQTRIEKYWVWAGTSQETEMNRKAKCIFPKCLLAICVLSPIDNCFSSWAHRRPSLQSLALFWLSEFFSLQGSTSYFERSFIDVSLVDRNAQGEFQFRITRLWYIYNGPVHTSVLLMFILNMSIYRVPCHGNGKEISLNLNLSDLGGADYIRRKIFNSRLMQILQCGQGLICKTCL